MFSTHAIAFSVEYFIGKRQSAMVKFSWIQIYISNENSKRILHCVIRPKRAYEI